MTQKNLQCNEKMFYLCTLKPKALQRVKVFLGYCTDFQLQIPERLQNLQIPNSENQRVRDFSFPKLPLPCQPRVNRFPKTYTIIVTKTNNRRTSSQRKSIPLTRTTSPLTRPHLSTTAHEKSPHQAPSRAIFLTKTC